VEDTIVKLKRDGASAVEMVLGLTDEQLATIPPAMGTITDGSKTLDQVVDGIIDHQRAHLESMKKALSQQPESAGEA
jgi:hypothetical protein